MPKVHHDFKLVSEYEPSGDQPKAIKELVEGIKSGEKEQILLGATGTGKTFTMANVIKEVGKPTLVMAHNKTLAGQLYSELKEFFPENAVEYFVSYYDYYQPESYMPATDTYIEKDSSTNEEIDRLRHAATNALLRRDDVIIVASVSAIYGLGDPKDYEEKMIYLEVGDEISRDQFLRKLVANYYERNDIDFQRKTFRVRGDVVEVFPAQSENHAYRVEFFGDEVDRIRKLNPLTGEVEADLANLYIYPSTHFVANDKKLDVAIERIERELEERFLELESENKLLEAQRLKQRTEYDIEMMKEMGYTTGIENYSRHMEGRKAGEPPKTLLDFFPADFLTIIDESHVTMPQIRGMVNGDLARKKMLSDYGFRLPSAMDNRPLKLEEFEEQINQIIYVSATPGDYEKGRTKRVVEQIIRPTGLLDPIVKVRPIMGQIDDLVGEINKRVEKNERIFITTLTKKMAEDLTDYFKDLGIKVKYLHSDIKALERTNILRDLRLGKFDVLIGINLLREGIDIPEVSLVAILDADKEGFLRNERSLIQTIGRAARNANGEVIMYADKVTDSMQKAIDETKRRRTIQEAYNKEHNITPKTIIKEIRDEIGLSKPVEDEEAKQEQNIDYTKLKGKERKEAIQKIEQEMNEAAKALDFERAALLRDILIDLKN